MVPTVHWTKYGQVYLLLLIVLIARALRWAG